jgi:hypothetical protein
MGYYDALMDMGKQDKKFRKAVETKMVSAALNFFEKISTQLLTVLIKRVILHT